LGAVDALAGAGETTSIHNGHETAKEIEIKHAGETIKISTDYNFTI
jgi:hypothetical protein